MPANDYIDDRLHRWANWSRSGQAQGLPRETVIYKMIRDGVLIKASGRPEPTALEDYETDQAVTGLKERKQEVWAVIVKHYLDRGTTAQKCKDLSISRRTYVDRLASGRDWVEAWIDARASISLAHA